MSTSYLSVYQQKLPFRTKLFVNLIMIYMFFLTAFYFSESELIKKLANGFAVFIFLLFFVFIIISSSKIKYPARMKISLYFFYFGMFTNFITTSFFFDYADFLKLLFPPMFIVTGYSLGRTIPLLSHMSRILYLQLSMLFFIPLVLSIIDVIRGSSISGDMNAIGIFANRNNAALYMISFLALLNGLFYIKKEHSIIFSLISGFIFGKLGVFIAVLLALVFVFLTRKNIILLLFFSLLIIIISYVIIPETLILNRLKSAYLSIQIIFDPNSPSLAQMSYGDLFVATGSTDLSLFFRLKHWDEILSLWGKESFIMQIFGSGVGSSVIYTSAELVPHNDYLRYFYECGVFTFLGFILLQISVLKGIGRNHYVIPFLVISIYFISENLANNYLAMVIYYFSAGLILRNINNKKIFFKSC